MYPLSIIDIVYISLATSLITWRKVSTGDRWAIIGKNAIRKLDRNGIAQLKVEGSLSGAFLPEYGKTLKAFSVIIV